MAGTSSASFLPLDSLGSGGKKYGESGRDTTMEALVSYGASFQHSSAALTLPMFTIAMTVSRGGSGTADLTLPRFTVAAQFGERYKLSLPSLTMAGHVNVTQLARGALTLPLLQIAGAGTTGANFSADLTLPLLTASARLGNRGALLLPLLQAAGHVTTAEHGHYAGTLPLLAVTGNVVVFSYPSRAALVLPALTAGPAGRAALTLPMLIVSGQQLVPVGAFEGWCMNVRNGYVTRWLNMPFTEFTSMGNRTFAIGAGGLYELGGDLDLDQPIAWKFETGLDNLNRSGMKRVPYLYLDGIIDGAIQITVIDDRNREFGYQYDTKQRGPVHMPHRRKLGNGIQTRSMAFRLESIGRGAYIELDFLEPEVSISQRSV